MIEKASYFYGEILFPLLVHCVIGPLLIVWG